MSSNVLADDIRITDADAELGTDSIYTGSYVSLAWEDLSHEAVYYLDECIRGDQLESWAPEEKKVLYGEVGTIEKNYNSYYILKEYCETLDECNEIASARVTEDFTDEIGVHYRIYSVEVTCDNGCVYNPNGGDYCLDDYYAELIEEERQDLRMSLAESHAGENCFNWDTSGEEQGYNPLMPGLTQADNAWAYDYCGSLGTDTVSARSDLVEFCCEGSCGTQAATGEIAPISLVNLRTTSCQYGCVHNFENPDYCVGEYTWVDGPPEQPACNDGVDNDGDGAIDLDDTMCLDANDYSETTIGVAGPNRVECNDGVDNDGDERIDLGGCDIDDDGEIGEIRAYSDITESFVNENVITEDECLNTYGYQTTSPPRGVFSWFAGNFFVLITGEPTVRDQDPAGAGYSQSASQEGGDTEEVADPVRDAVWYRADTGCSSTTDDTEAGGWFGIGRS